jgi:hypothetical protein
MFAPVTCETMDAEFVREMNTKRKLTVYEKYAVKVANKRMRTGDSTITSLEGYDEDGYPLESNYFPEGYDYPDEDEVEWE